MGLEVGKTYWCCFASGVQQTKMLGLDNGIAELERPTELGDCIIRLPVGWVRETKKEALKLYVSTLEQHVKNGQIHLKNTQREQRKLEAKLKAAKKEYENAMDA